MSSTRWHRVKEALHAALEIPPAERAAFLNQACGDDESLRQEVESLLLAHQDAGEFLSQPALGGDDPELEDDRIGPYLIVRHLAEGGMGTVYLAVRDDDAFRKTVAVKLVRDSVPHADVLERFRQERQILADLEHPNIAAILDGGTTRSGRPYFVMEYVKGKPIDVFCAERALNVRDRVALFRLVCDAVRYAHQKLVVHRDIKPSNILVTDDGTPKLLDFGIAKLLDDRIQPVEGPESKAPSMPPVSGTTPPLRTTASRLAMTPAFASPEQLRLEPLTTSTDVYSLGVVLYKLLTGTLPVTLDSVAPDEWARVLDETKPAAPSERVNTQLNGLSNPLAENGLPSGSQLARTLRGDLDHILLKALSKKPDGRYASAEQFSDDLRRYLESYATIASPDSIRYHAQKFVRRNATAVFLGSAVFTLSIVSSVAGFTLYRRAERARLEAEAARTTAETNARTASEVSDFLVELFNVSDPGEARSTEITARELLDDGATRIEDELAGEPQIQARLLGTLGRVHRNLGLYTEARRLLERSLDVHETQLGRDHPEVAESLRQLAGLHLDEGQPESALPLLERALRIQEQKLGAATTATATTLSAMSFALNIGGRSEEARSAAERAIAIFEATDPSVPEYPLALNNLARAYQETGDLAAAVPIMERVHAAMLKTHGPEHRDVGRSLINLGAAYYRTGQYERAENTFTQALEVLDRVLGPEHPNVGVLVQNLAMTARRNGNLERSKALYERSIEIHAKSIGALTPEIARTFINLGNVYAELGELEDAVKLYERAITAVHGDTGAPHPLLGTTLLRMGIAYFDSGEEERAREILGTALETTERLSGAEHVSVAFVLPALARLDRRGGRYDAAEARLSRALQILENEVQPGHDARIECLVEWTLLLVARGDIGDAEQKWKESLAAIEASSGDIAAARHFFEARYWALRGNVERATESARESASLGTPVERIRQHPDLASLSSQPGFASVVESAIR